MKYLKPNSGHSERFFTSLTVRTKRNGLEPHLSPPMHSPGFDSKRLLDVTLSGIVVLSVLSWLLPLLGLLILLDSRGPVFFIQKRIGRSGRLFSCIKLRTMMEGRNQISRFGRFLRISKLDELPQFFNVLVGHMSIVGPRPHMISDHILFSRMIGHRYHRRHQVLPGITGLAQIRGYEGPIKSHRKLRGRLKMDLLYVEKSTFKLDVWIIWKTVGLLFRTKFN